MRGIKVVTIGGGSSYTPELVEGLIKRHNELPVKELWLVDIEEGKEKLDIVGNLARRMVKKAGIDMEIHLTLDRRAALKNADFVTTQFRVGQLDAREKDELIPLKYGVIGQETNGPGGMFKALRTIPVIFDIIKDCEELCPDSWIISFTNPSGINAEAVFRHTGWKKFIGLCNGPVNMIKDIEKILDVETEDNLNVLVGGINHMIYALDIQLNGENANKLLIDKMINKGTKESLKNIVDIPWGNEFLKGYGYLGIGYLRYYLQKQQMLEHCLEDAENNRCRAKVVKEVEKKLFEMYKDENLDIKPKELEKRGGAYYSDAACNLISSLYNDKGDIQVVDTLNNGAISNLPDDVAVEVSCVITKDGPKPISVGPLPIQVVGLIQQLKAFEILTTNAAVTGDYNDALVAMSINPLVQSEITAKKILDEMLEAHKKYLPQFFK
ncbi:6-phospho-beta-glucosidase [Clostridium paraputrificum]|uniref:6-phospho-beta-glucosidase n=2 Tax=Clostridium paraputrificum TaxID=29363 RepID=A0A6N3CDJ9_9CLOT